MNNNMTVLIVVLLVILVVLMVKLVSGGSSEGYHHASSKKKSPSGVTNIHIEKMAMADPRAVAANFGSNNGIPANAVYYFAWTAPAYGFHPDQGYNGTYDIKVLQGTTVLYEWKKASGDTTAAPIPSPAVGPYTINITANNGFGSGKMVTGTGTISPTASIQSVKGTISVGNPGGSYDLPSTFQTTATVSYSSGIDPSTLSMTVTGGATGKHDVFMQYKSFESGKATNLDNTPLVMTGTASPVTFSLPLTSNLDPVCTFTLSDGTSYTRSQKINLFFQLYRTDKSGKTLVDSTNYVWTMQTDPTPADITGEGFNANDPSSKLGGFTNMVKLGDVSSMCQVPSTGAGISSAYWCNQDILNNIYGQKKPVNFGTTCGSAYPKSFVWDDTKKVCTLFKDFIPSTSITTTSDQTPGDQWVGWTPYVPASS